MSHKVVLRALACVIAGLASVHAQAQPSTPTPTVDELVARNLKARGGVERLKTVQAMRLTGSMEAPNGSDVPTTVYMARPNMIRQEATVDGRVAVQAFDGRRGWLSPMMGNSPVEVPAGVAKRMAEQADFDGPLVDLAAKGHRVELVGPGHGGRRTGHQGEANQEVWRGAVHLLRRVDRAGNHDPGRGRPERPEAHHREPVLGLPHRRRRDHAVQRRSAGQWTETAEITLSSVEFPTQVDVECSRCPDGSTYCVKRAALAGGPPIA